MSLPELIPLNEPMTVMLSSGPSPWGIKRRENAKFCARCRRSKRLMRFTKLNGIKGCIHFKDGGQ